MSANLAMAVAGTGLPAFCLFIAGLYRIRDDEMDGLELMSGRNHIPATSFSDSCADMFAQKYGVAA